MTTQSKNADAYVVEVSRYGNRFELATLGTYTEAEARAIAQELERHQADEDKARGHGFHHRFRITPNNH